MYNSEYFIFVAKQNLDSEYHSSVEKLALLIPESGRLELPRAQIAEKIGLNTNDFAEFLDLLIAVRPMVVRYSDDILLFDYLKKDIDYVHHLRNAYSNIGLLDPDF